MSRKDYQLIAAAIKGQVNFASGDQLVLQVIKAIAISVAMALATDNPRFDRDRFMQACGFDQQ